MVTLGYALAPFLALAGTWLLLLAHDGTRVDRGKAARAGALCLVAALLAVGGAALADGRHQAPREPSGQVSSPA